MTKIPLLLILSALVACSPKGIDQKLLKQFSQNDKTALVFVNLENDDLIVNDEKVTRISQIPCSTFKIWNTLIGVEAKLIHSSQDPFYKWDGKKRFLDTWNQDLNLKEAFGYSCVPAYQQLAHKIGRTQMQVWIDKIHYGNGDLSAGVDRFWLPNDENTSILISPEQQAFLIAKLVQGKLPFSKKALQILEEIMLVQTSAKGRLYGKTGTAFEYKGTRENLGWFVGYVTGLDFKYSFACLLQGENLTGKDAKAVIEKILLHRNLL